MDTEGKIKHQFDKIDASNAWPLVIQEIKKECSKHDYSVSEAKKLENKFLNRYRDVIPYDHTRIVLSKAGCDYINASLVKVEKADRHYILTQGPLPFTTSHFWLMVWEQNCKAVIMLNKVIEKNMIKCHQYWPVGSKNGGDDDTILADVGLKVELLSETDCSYYITRKLRLSDVESNDSREILHFQYTTWPDHGIPQSPTAFLHFLGDIRRSGALSSDVGPAVVHCSAGIGRSGSFCLVDSCLVIIKDKKSADDVTIRDVLLEMRKYRMGLVQTAEQLRFCYLAIMQGLTDNFEDGEMPLNDSEINNHEDEPPPLPPPRSESLPPLPPLPQPPPDDDDDEDDDDDDYDDDDESPSESSSESSRAAVTQSENGPTSPTSEGLRQRTKEKQERTAKKVEEMKRKQKEAEDWAQLKRSLLSPLSLSIGAFIVGGAVAFSYYIMTRV